MTDSDEPRGEPDASGAKEARPDAAEKPQEVVRAEPPEPDKRLMKTKEFSEDYGRFELVEESESDGG
jgi:hypothetical protein